MIIMNAVVNIRETQDTVERFLNSFYGEYQHNSVATAKAYRADVVSFIESQMPLGLGTPVENVAQYISYTNVTDFRNKQIEKGLQPNSVNRKVVAIREFVRHLRAHDVEVSIEFFENIKSLKGGSDSYEVLSIPEAVMLAEWLRDNEKFRATDKYYYTLLAADTGIRAEALSQLTPSNFIETDEEVLIKGVDKGKKNFTKRISKELFHAMKRDIKEWTALNKPLFGFDSKNRTDMIRRALKGLGWENRNIAFHSLKKAAVNNAFETTGDIRIAMKVGAHESVATTQKYLEDSGDDFLGAISNSNLAKIKDLDYEDFSKEELIEAVSKMSKHFQYHLKTNLIQD